MEKQGIVKPGVTPPDKASPGEKKAGQQTTQELDNDARKQLADAAAKPLTRKDG